MTFQSILFKNIEDRVEQTSIEVPNFLEDLNLDQVINTITALKEEYNLKPFFYTTLKEIDAIKYRQEVALDLENITLLENIKSFAEKMALVRRYLGMIAKLYSEQHKEGWFLETVDVYCDAVSSLARDLSLADIKSRGLMSFRQYLSDYCGSNLFTSLLSETKNLKLDLSTIKYSVIIKGSSISVLKYEEAINYSTDVEETFIKFKQGAAKDYKVKLSLGSGMNHVEAKILDLVAKLFPDIFMKLNQYCVKNNDFLDETISVFDREIQFYVAYLDYIKKIRQMGLKFCYPLITNQNKEVYAYESYDIALARKSVFEDSPVVSNDFFLKDKERIFIVSGPNQGGKTTFARTFGQLHYLALLGLLVPGREAQLFLFDKLFTHFEKEEDLKNLRGKLQDDLVRIHAILELATPNSLIIMNEIFTSTTLKDAVILSKKILEKIIELDSLCVCVTFIDELASMSEKTVSMVSTVVPENPTLRTYKIIRKPADGLAFAISIAEKYRLTYDILKERIKP